MREASGWRTTNAPRFRPVDPKVRFPELEHAILAFWDEANVFRAFARAARGRPGVGLLRRTADGERQAAHRPRGHPHVQGRLPALPHDDRPPRAPQGRMGLSRPAGRDRSGEGDRNDRQARHRGVRGRRVQRAMPRVRPAIRPGLGGPDRADRLLDRHGRRLLDDGPLLHRVRLVVAEASARARDAGRSRQGDRVLPAMRHGALGRRSGPGLRDRRGPERLRPVPDRRGAATPSSSARPSSCGRRRRGRSRRTPASRSTPSADYVVAEKDGERLLVARPLVAAALGDELDRPDDRARSRRSSGRGTNRRIPTSRAPTPSSRARSSQMEDGTGIVHMAPAFGAEDLDVGRVQGWPVFKPVGDDGRFTDRAPEFVRGLFVKDADPVIIEDLAARGRLLRSEHHRAHVSVLLALRDPPRSTTRAPPGTCARRPSRSASSR